MLKSVPKKYRKNAAFMRSGVEDPDVIFYYKDMAGDA